MLLYSFDLKIYLIKYNMFLCQFTCKISGLNVTNAVDDVIVN